MLPVTPLSIALLIGCVAMISGARPGRTQDDCIKCSAGGQCLGPQLICDFSRDCPSGQDEDEALCQHGTFGSSYTVGIDDPIIVHSADNRPVKVAATNTWFSVFRFQGPPGTDIAFDFTEVDFTDNTKFASKSYIATGSGSDPTVASTQRARMSPGQLDTPTLTHAYSTGSSEAWILVSHPKGEKVDFSMRVSAVGGSPPGAAGGARGAASSSGCFPCVSDDLGCVEPRWVCDGTADCNNGEDEMHCPCDGFMCSDDKCIPHGFHCDGIIDCSNDEENCTA